MVLIEMTAKDMDKLGFRESAGIAPPPFKDFKLYYCHECDEDTLGVDRIDRIVLVRDHETMDRFLKVAEDLSL